LCLVLATGAAAAAQPPASPTGGYDTEWAEYRIMLIDPVADHGGRTVDVVSLAAPAPGGPSWEFRDRSTGQVLCHGWANGYAECPEWAGSLTWYEAAGPTGTLETRWFVLDLESLSAHAPGRRWEVGTKQAPAPTRAVTFSLTPGQVVSGSVGVKMTATGLQAGAYRWYISLDGRQVSYRVESTTGITWWWNTSGLAAGTHALSVRVVDAGGREAPGGVTVRK
jgi:hypothetical protein